ncbi:MULTISPECIES: IucA/IucC family protein [Acinetobacter]|jgi:siderophore synthetase component|uniref:IucA/IucC family protein n=3 Tax=Acinetobacter TaxID=469 RepID=A0AAJ6IBS7_ACIJO|nr:MULTISPECIES: IucA/IucC family protein [Acinetobacter]NWK63508.1 siderophore biosynthesis protein [Acinetobacter sp. SwsAc3]ALV73130.1 siderophore biosynthesis protein [Acinetobacter johnsonii XBB1]MCV2452189.1 siderophore biosynthesis protein [Acinetobacter johnsonii]MDH1532979.1 siderophore biosynthesis protein [Acinetobacter johnsonii]MDH1727366.1 siderophore biosynthesis protein [Acinetobacter johnsonii]
MKELANRLAMQHLVNAYSQETGKVSLFEKYQQNSTQLAFSQGLTLLSLPLSLIQAQLFVPLSYVSRVGRHRIADLPQIFQKGQKLNFSAAAMVSLLLEELVQQSEGHVDAASLVERWIQSRDALQQFLNIRAEDFDALVQAEQGFIESEQALVLGHSMHPAPKSRTGFVHEDWQKYSPEACGQTQLHYWLVAPENIAEGTALEQAFSIQLKQEIKWHLSESELETLAAYAHYKLLPLHPWQARYLQSKVWFKSLKAKLKIIDLGEKAWIFSPTTSVRTLASFNAPWMLKPSLSVMITNSIRVNLAKECHRGEMTHRLWHSELGQSILKQCPTLKAVNDPAWIALQLDGEIIDETICIVRDQPFTPEQQVTCIASLCQDHPLEERNRFNALFDQIAFQQKLEDKAKIALDWFKVFLNISLTPLMYVYHRYGMAFESHQQNVLVELKDGWPQWLWLRDNQGFYYIEELADEILQQFPELHDKAHAVGSKTFVDERFSYYFFGNTLFGIINAIGATGFVSEQDLLSVLQQHLFDLLKQYPDSSLIQSLLYQPTLPYKGNLLTRLYELDELIAPVENQSVYIQLANPLYIKQEDALYA